MKTENESRRETADSPELVWSDARTLPVQGLGYPDAVLFRRLPERFRGVVPDDVFSMSRHATGVSLRFVTDSDLLSFRWSVPDDIPPDIYMTPAAQSGLDIYGMTPKGWRLVRNAPYRRDLASPSPNGPAGEVSLPWEPGRECLVYLPLRAEVLGMSVGVRPGCAIRKFPRRFPWAAKPVVHYGTSIVHGGCVSRPGLAFTNQYGRALDLDVVNLGFSGAGRMEPAMRDVVGEIDASLFVLDCDWNMWPDLQRERYEPFVRRIRELHPATPILLCGGCTQFAEPKDTEEFARGVFDRLKAEDPAKWADLHFLSGVGMLPQGDGECTFDFCHPNDYGSMQMGRVYAEAVRTILEAEIVR